MYYELRFEPRSATQLIVALKLLKYIWLYLDKFYQLKMRIVKICAKYSKCISLLGTLVMERKSKLEFLIFDLIIEIDIAIRTFQKSRMVAPNVFVVLFNYKPRHADELEIK